jgi:hypothetical protein
MSIFERSFYNHAIKGGGGGVKKLRSSQEKFMRNIKL